MSIKTLSANNGGTVIIAIILSVVAHGALAGLLVAMQPIGDAFTGRFFDKPSEPVIVDVIELPPDTVSLKPPARPTFYTDRNHSVVKETWPMQQGIGTVVVERSPATSAPGGGDSQASQPATASRSSVVKAAGQRADGNEGSVTVKAGQQPSANPMSSAGKQGASMADKAVGPRPKLFPSKERLDELARTYVAEAPKGETGKVLNLNTSEIRYHKYLINMKNKIESLWEYPPVAARNGWQGSLKIDFTIKRDGTVSEIKLVKSSNNPVLDDAAITVLRLAAPFTTFPEGFEVEEITIKGEFVYVIANSPVQ